MHKPQEEPQPPQQRLCLSCHRPLYGRRGKLHCSNRCKNKRHNEKNRDPNSYEAQVTRALKKNYRILLPLMVPTVTNDLGPLSEGFFFLQGYDFSVFTGTSKNPKTGGTIYWVYSLGLEKTKDSKGYRLNIRSNDGTPQL